MIFRLEYDWGMIQYLTQQLFLIMLIFMLFGSLKEIKLAWGYHLQGSQSACRKKSTIQLSSIQQLFAEGKVNILNKPETIFIFCSILPKKYVYKGRYISYSLQR